MASMALFSFLPPAFMRFIDYEIGKHPPTKFDDTPLVGFDNQDVLDK